MYNDAPEAGLASLLASRGRNGDSMLVHMTPGEVQGLQALALAHGGSLSINPETGLYEASFLKKILPMIAGAVLNTFAPGVGTAIGGLFGATGTAAATLGTGLLVGGATALIEGDLKKGLMAGLGAYSGASLSAGLKAAAAAPTAEQVAAKELVAREGAQQTAEQLGLTESATELAKPSMLATGPRVNPFTGGAATTPALASVGGAELGISAAPTALSAAPTMATAPMGLAAIKAAPMATLAASQAPAAATGPLAGVNALFRPEGRTAFMEALGGGYKTPLAQSLSKYAVMTGAMDAFTPEMQQFSTQPGEELVYIPGERNPMYGMGRQYGYFQPGQYFKRTPQGLVPVNPYQRAPGMAMGGPVQPDNEGYIDQETGTESYADGGYVGVDPRSLRPEQMIITAPAPEARVTKPVEPASAPVTPYSAPAATAADAVKRYEQMVYGPAPAPVNTQAVMDYVANLNKRAQRPLIYPYPGAETPGGGTKPGTGGGGGGGGGYDPGDYGGGTQPNSGGGAFNPYDPAFGGAGGIGGQYQSGIGAGGSNYYQTFQPNIQEKFPVNIDPTKAVDKALGNTFMDKAQQKFMDWAKYRFTDPTGLIGTAIGMTGAGAIGTYLWDKLSPKVKEYFAKVEELTPEEAAEAEAEATALAQTMPAEQGKYGGGGGGFDPEYGRSKYMDNSLQDFLDRYWMDQMMEPRGYISVQELGMAKGGPVKSMQAGGMTAINPYGAAMGEDYNFGFSGGGETEYAAAGKLLDGPGDGMSDDIPAVIRGKGVQRAALADGEFVVPADVVSHLGNGSTKAGAKKLHQMMARVRQARTGKKKQAPEVKTDKYLPA